MIWLALLLAENAVLVYLVWTHGYREGRLDGRLEHAVEVERRMYLKRNVEGFDGGRA